MRATEAGARAGLLCALLLGLAPGVGSAPAPSPPAPAPDEVVDATAGLAWARCAVGQQWDGKTCSGTALRLDHAHAMAAASARRETDGRAWRLPRAAELRQLGRLWAETQGRAPRPFPAAPEGWYWSSTKAVETGAVNQYDYGNIRRGINEHNVARLSFLHGMAVQVPGGEMDGHVPKRERLPVRLVRNLERPATAAGP